MFAALKIRDDQGAPQSGTSRTTAYLRRPRTSTAIACRLPARSLPWWPRLLLVPLAGPFLLCGRRSGRLPGAEQCVSLRGDVQRAHDELAGFGHTDHVEI